MADPIDAVDDFDPSDFIQQERRNATVSMLQGLDADPEKAARALQLARATGTGPHTVYDNLENFEAQTKSVLAARLLADNEYLRQFVNTQPLAAHLASDDYGNLDKVSQSVSKAFPGRYGGGGTLAAFISGAFRGVQEGFGEGMPGTFSWVKDPEERAKAISTFPPLGPTSTHTIITATEVVLRSLSAAVKGAAEGAKEGAEEFYLTLTGDEGGARRVGREAAALVEYATTKPPPGRVLSPNQVAILNEVNKVKADAVQALQRAAPWLDRGLEPPLGIDPTIDKLKIEQSKVELDNLAEAEKDAQKSLLKERSPEAFAEMIRGQTQAQIGISPDAVRRLYGDKEPIPDDGVLGFVPRLADQLQLAELSGSDILIPVADWLAHVDPTIAKELRDDIRVRPGGVTKNEGVRVKASEMEEPPKPPEPKENVVDLGEKREQKQVEGFHKELMGTVAERAQGMAKQGQEYHESGKLPLPVGTRFMTAHSQANNLLPFEVKAHWVDPKNPEKYGYHVERGVEGQEGWERTTVLVNDPKNPRIAELSSQFKPFTRLQAVVKAVRESAALKPIVEEKRLTLRRTEGEYAKSGTFKERHDFNIVDDKGGWLGSLAIAEEQGGKLLYIDNIETDGPNTIGPAAIRGLLRQLKVEFPNAQELTGLRVSGSRDAAGKPDYATVKLSEDPSWRELEMLSDDFQMLAREDVGGGVVLISRPTAEFTAKEKALVEKVKAIVARMAPQLEDVRVVDRIERHGKDASGVFVTDGMAHRIIAVSLGADDVGLVARHEVGHYLRESGLIRDKEWRMLEQAAEEYGWLGKYDIRDRYAGYEKDKGALLEEAIVEEIGTWGAKTEPARARYNQAVRDVLDRLVKFFKDILDAVKEEFGHTPKLDELFEKIESGEVGSRKVAGQGKAETKAAVGPKQGELDVTNMADKKPFDRAAAIGMTEEQMRRYMKLIDKQQQEDLAHATKKLVDAEKRKQTATWKDNERKVREEVAEDFNTRPDVQVDEYFRTGRLYGESGPKPKLAADALTPEQRAVLPESFVADKGGMAPDDIASLFGYRTGTEMIEHLSTYTEARKQSGMQPMAFNRRLVDAEVERRMQERYGDLQENVLEAVKDQVFSETQLDMLHEETVAAAMKANAAIPLPKDMIKQGVLAQIDGLNLAGLKLRDYEAAAGRAGREFEMALLKGDYQEAFRQKQRQYMSIIAAKEVMAVEKEAAQFERIAKRYRPREIDGTEWAAKDSIQILLNEAGYQTRVTLDEAVANLQKNGYDSIDSYVVSYGSYGEEFAVTEGLQQRVKPFEEMTVGEFREFRDAVKSLDHVGRKREKITVAGDIQDYKKWREDAIRQLKERPIQPTEADQGVVPWILYNIDAPLTRIEELVKDLDFREEMGPFFKAIIIPYAKSKAHKMELLEGLSKHLRSLEIDKDWQRGWDTELPQSFIMDPHYEVGFKATRWTMLKMMMNMGTESNLDALARGLAAALEKPKTGSAPVMPSREAVNAMKNEISRWVETHATEQDWKFIQQIWQPFKEWQPIQEQMYHTISGVSPKMVPRRTIQTPFGDFEGGYFPLISDSERLVGRGIREEKPLTGGGPMGKDAYRAMTHNSHMKERTNSVYWVDISNGMEQLAGRMQQHIHDLAYREFVIDAGKILYDPVIKDAIKKYYGPAYEKQFVPWLERVTNEYTGNEKALDWYNAVLRRVRINLIASALPVNPNVMLSPSLGTANLKAGYAFNSNRAANMKMVMEHSDELKHLVYNLDRDISTAIDTIANKGKYTRWQADAVQTLFKPLTWAEQQTRAITFYRKFMEAKEKGYSDYEAAALGDSEIRERHGAAAVGDLPAMLASKSEWVRTATVFMTYFSTMRNWARQIPHHVRQGDGKGLTAAMWGVFGTATLYNAALFTDKKEKEGYAHWLGRVVLSTPMSMVPYIREAWAYGTEGFNPKSPIFGVIKGVGDVLKDGKNYFQGKKVKDPLKHAIQVPGLMLGVPGSLQAGRWAEFGKDLATGEQRPRDLSEWMRGFKEGEARARRM